jgi:hypothetical protein
MYDMHYNKTGVKIAFIRERDFENGKLSVWRVKVPDTASLGALVPKLNIPSGQILKQILYVTAGDVRRILVLPGPSKLCVVDETEVDDAGNKDPHHAHISPCRDNMTEGDERRKMLGAARTELYNLYKFSGQWDAP